MNAPTLTATTVGAQVVPALPSADVEAVDVNINDTNPVTIQIEATNIPLGTTVDVRVVPRKGNSFVVASTPLAGTLAFSTATADVVFPAGLSEVQLRASFMGAAAKGATHPGEKGRRFANGGSRGERQVASKTQPRNKTGLPRYRRINAIVGVETGPGPDQMTYTTATGHGWSSPLMPLGVERIDLAVGSVREKLIAVSATIGNRAL